MFLKKGYHLFHRPQYRYKVFFLAINFNLPNFKLKNRFKLQHRVQCFYSPIETIYSVREVNTQGQACALLPLI